MSAFFILLLCCFISVEIEGEEYDYCVLPKISIPNYYWRVYQGIVPEDAIAGGITAGGFTTYIGQLLLKGLGKDGIIPGNIYAVRNEIEIAMDGVYNDKSYATILCSDAPSKFEWKYININEADLANEHLVIGGYEVNRTVYVGRGSYNTSLVVGKVFIDGAKGLWIPKPTGELVKLTDFEVLTYTPVNCFCRQKRFKL